LYRGETNISLIGAISGIEWPRPRVLQREAVEMGLKALFKLKQREQIREYRGKLDWEGDLGDLRTDD
jgi:hypothetical protein